ncbi:MAG: hypothetical protein ACP5VQ_04680 [Phycisphaerae bacterium]
MTKTGTATIVASDAAFDEKAGMVMSVNSLTSSPIKLLSTIERRIHSSLGRINSRKLG